MRHHPEIPIRNIGAVLPVQIGVSEERRKLIRAEGRLEPDPVVVTMLVDTGASCSWIRLPYMKQLGLQPRSWFDVERVEGTEHRPAYEVSLILGGIATQYTKRFEILVGGAEFKHTPHDGLLGRDILRSLQLTWNGPSEHVRMHYD